MNQTLEDQLQKKYPKIFKQKSLSPQETCMCWGIECGDGWYNILDKMCGQIQWWIDCKQEQHKRDVAFNLALALAQSGDRSGLEEWIGDRSYRREEFIEELIEAGIRQVTPWIPQVVAIQVKEKFGTLRFYYEGGDDFIRGVVSMADAMSEVTCEVCGSPGWIHGRGWVSVRCDEHAGK